MDLDVEAYGSWLLDWLYDQPTTHKVAAAVEAREAAMKLPPEEAFAAISFPGDTLDPTAVSGSDDTAPFFARLGLPGVTGHPIAGYLERQGWIAERHDIRTDWLFSDWFSDDIPEPGDPIPEPRNPMQMDVPSPFVRITPVGIGVARQNRVNRHDRVDAKDPLSKRLLQWLYSQQANTGRPANLINFLVSDYSAINNSLAFTLHEVQGVALNLHQHGLITDPGKQPEQGLGAQLIELTSEGYECNHGYDADVRRYLDRNRQGSSTYITLSGHNTANVAVNSPSAEQGISTGVSVEEALHFADFVNERAGVLRPKEGSTVSFEVLASQLRDAATCEAPDKRRLRRFIETLMRALEAATPTVVAQAAIELGEKAIHAIGG